MACSPARNVETKMQDNDARDWSGKANGVPPPPTRAQVDEVSSQQHLITDEWAPQPTPGTSQEADAPALKPTKDTGDA